MVNQVCDDGNDLDSQRANAPADSAIADNDEPSAIADNDEPVASLLLAVDRVFRHITDAQLRAVTRRCASILLAIDVLEDTDAAASSAIDDCCRKLHDLRCKYMQHTMADGFGSAYSVGSIFGSAYSGSRCGLHSLHDVLSSIGLDLTISEMRSLLLIVAAADDASFGEMVDCCSRYVGTSHPPARSKAHCTRTGLKSESATVVVGEYLISMVWLELIELHGLLTVEGDEQDTMLPLIEPLITQQQKLSHLTLTNLNLK